jgi:hypothetical protein
MGTEGSFPGEKRRGHEADHLPPTSAEVKKTLIYTSTRLDGVFLNWLSTGKIFVFLNRAIVLQAFRKSLGRTRRSEYRAV